MKRDLYIICLLLSIACGCRAQKSLVVLHTNDTHSTIMPLSSLLADTIKAGRAGFLRRLALIQKEREQEPDLLLFDSGDFSQGSAYFTRFKGEVEVKLMNKMGYDAVTIGNHEFDFGVDNLARIYRMATFPVVCANYDFGTTDLADIVKPYIVLKRKGVRIGVFGLSPRLEGLVATDNYRGITYLDPAESARKVIAKLRKQEHCDVVICLSHLGWNIQPDFDDNMLLPQISGVDLMLGGHSHSNFKQLEWLNDATGKRVAIDQNGKHAIFVGKMTLELNRSTRNRK